MNSSPVIALELDRLVAALEERGELLRIRRAVDPRFEVSAVIRAVQKGPNLAVLFERVNGSRFPVLSNVLGDPARLAGMLGAERTSLARHWTTLLDRDPS